MKKIIKGWLVENKYGDGLPYIFTTEEKARLFLGINKDRIYPCKIIYVS